MTKMPFNTKVNRAIKCLKLIYSYVCGPFNIQARGGYEYFLTFANDYSRYSHVYLLRRRSDSFEKFKEYRTLVENQLDKVIKTL